MTMMNSYFDRWKVVLLTVGLSFVPVAAQTPATPARSFQLAAETPAFWNLLDHDAHLKTLANGFGFTEGPVWDKAGFVWVSDEVKNKIYRVHSDGTKEEMISIVDPDGNTYDREHRLIDCASIIRGIIRLSEDGKSYKVLADSWEGKKFNSPNDVVLGPDKAFYFSDPALDMIKGETKEIPFQGVYRLDPSGKVTLLTKELTQPNGLAFSPDGKTFYVDDSEQRNIRVYSFHADGTIADGRIFGEEKGAADDGVPDGIRIDKRGNLFVTGPKGIWVWNAKGVHLGTIELPEQPANMSWGGKDYSDLYITATTSVYVLHTRTHGFVPYE